MVSIVNFHDAGNYINFFAFLFGLRAGHGGCCALLFLLYSVFLREESKTTS